ncbi:putative secreted RxLR effector protein [Phytophthora cinnamomi]|uniref:putative secreted RxLR effector protein n=1 Tax=Phytophthora cinnamomi TaxID=4785 RepID=UPI003559E500|nr:putative secreted RxLR effector protein [Phytophthora cinnamomi]
MRRHPLTLLATAALAALAAAEVQADAPSTQLWADSLGTSVSRLLRTHRDTAENEERGITASDVSTLTNTLKSTTTIDDDLKALIGKGESADDAFKLLTLDKAADDLLSNPRLQSWISHLKLFNEQNPTKQTTLIATLTAHYGDEGLAKIIEQGKQVASTEALANRIQAEQFRAWLDGKKSADDVFKLLTLDKAADDVLGNSHLQTWISYMKLYNKENRKQHTSLISTLRAHYDDLEVAKMIGKAKQVPGTATMATYLEIEQVHLWLETAQTPDDIFKMLQLDKAKTDLFKEPQVNAWMKYMDAYNKKFPREKVTFFSSWKDGEMVASPLKDAYKDDDLVPMLIAAKNVPGTETIATRVQGELTQRWMAEKKEPDQIFLLLKLDDPKTKDTLLQNPLLIAWLRYLDAFNSKYSGHSDLAISTMMGKFSSKSLVTMILKATKNPSTESVAKRLDTELVEKWFQNGNTPSSVYGLLSLKQDGNKLFDSPFVASWLKFTDYFNANVKPGDATSAISILRKDFKDDVLAKMLVDANKNPSMKKTSFGLLEDLTAYWMTKTRDPVKVYHWLRLHESQEEDVVGLFNEYWRVYKEHVRQQVKG